MKALKTFRYDKFIITYLILFFMAFSSFFVICAMAAEGEGQADVSTFEEFKSALSDMMSTGGTICLKDDITIPAGESFIYSNGRYRKNITIETGEHSIYVEGYGEFWPCLTINGGAEGNEIFHVLPGGDLRLYNIEINAGEDGTAVIQDEGSFLLYGSQTDMGLPEFSCTGKIIKPQTMTAAAYWNYNSARLPMVIVPEGADFSGDLLPQSVYAVVNRDSTEYEEEVPVIWDESTFPQGEERALVKGSFSQEYAQFGDCEPLCLVVFQWEKEPFFTNVYLESAGSGYDMVFMNAISPQAGSVYIQSSYDGENWRDIDGTDGYEPAAAEAGEEISWILFYDNSQNGAVRPKYYRLRYIKDDGSQSYSDSLMLEDGMFFVSSDIEGGRGGETSPGDGENQISGGGHDTSGQDDTGSPTYYPDKPANSHITHGEDNETGEENTSGEDNILENAANSQGENSGGYGENTSAHGEKDRVATAQIIAGVIIVFSIVAGSVFLFVFKRKK